jgi:hypothetical protein
MTRMLMTTAVVLVLVTVVAGGIVTDPNDKLMMDLVATARGPVGWSLNWDISTRPCQDWEGVSRNASGWVVGIFTRRARFNNTLLNEVHHLPALRLFNLCDKNVTSLVPIGAFQELNTLRLDHTAFTIGRLALFFMLALEKLTMNNNKALQSWMLSVVGLHLPQL